MQVIILNALYIASVSFLTFTIVSTSSVVSRLLDLLRGLTVRDTEVMSMSLTAQWFAMALNLTMILASLYFMWSIRHPKAE
jgi:hypothetical protein